MKRPSIVFQAPWGVGQETHATAGQEAGATKRFRHGWEAGATKRFRHGWEAGRTRRLRHGWEAGGTKRFRAILGTRRLRAILLQALAPMALIAALACACSVAGQNGKTTVAAQSVRAAAAAQSGAATAAAQSFRIAGRLVNAVTGDPVQGAVVAALDADGTRRIASAESAADGSFAINGLGAAKYALTASKRGYVTGFYMQHGEYSSAVVTGPGEDTEHLVFQLEPTAVIHGTVTADGGDAVAGATVGLFEKPKGNEPGARIEQAGGVETDDTGAYEFAHLEAGSYYVVVQARPWYAIHRANPASGAVSGDDPTSALEVAYPITYYDSTVDQASATPVVLAAGSRVEANVNLHAVPALHLKVQAPVQSDGSPATPKLRIGIFGTDFDEQFEQRDEKNREGETVEFYGIAPGRYELTEGNPPRVAELDAETSGSVDPSLGTAAMTVTGTLVNAAGALLGGDARAILTPAESKASRPAMSARVEQGAFTLTPVTPGTWALSVVREDHELPVEAIALNGRKLAGNRFAVADQPIALKVTVDENPLRVEGFAKKDGKGVAGAMVVAVPKNGALFPALARRDQSDSDGSFSLRDVAPGAYTIVAIDNAWDDLDWSSPEVIGRYLSGGVGVRRRQSPGGRG